MAGARHFTELIAWQLADRIRVETLKLTSRPGFARDMKLHAQTEDAANSICRNIAEGFACDTHAEFARFLGFSRRSLNELQDALRGAELKGYVAPGELRAIRVLARRLYPAIGRLAAHLRRTGDRPSGPAARAERTQNRPLRRESSTRPRTTSAGDRAES